LIVDSQKKIIKIVATRCQILRLKCTKFDFGWAPPQTPLGELTALPIPSSCDAPRLRGEGRAKGKEEDGRGREGEGRNAFPHLFNPTLTHSCI